MKILILSTSDIKGGAAKVAFELSRGLIRRGHEVEMHVTSKASDADFVHEYTGHRYPPEKITEKVIHRLGINQLHSMWSTPFSKGRAFYEQFDLIHLHDLPSPFNFFGLPWLSKIRPTAWTIHSMYPFTGGCVYAYDCDRWQKSCGSCPQFGQFPLHWLHRDGTRLVNRAKRSIYNNSTIYPIGVSRWLTEQLSQSMLGHFPLKCILNPVDTEIFSPIDKAEAKKQLGIPPERKTLMFALAANLLDTRKGVETIIQALPLLKTQGIHLIPTAITSLTEEFQKVFQQFDSLPPKHIDDTQTMALYYNAADVVWHPTLADTSSLVSLESMACGTPVIAAAVGGVPEIVRHETNGLLIPPQDPQALAQATDRLFADDSFRRSLGQKGRTIIEQEFSFSRFLDSHESYYQKILHE